MTVSPAIRWFLVALWSVVAASPGLAQTVQRREPAPESYDISEDVTVRDHRAQGPLVWFTSAQTGSADTFQLALGGTFGAGPAWQNKVTTGLGNAFREGDSVSIYGWNSLDVPSHANEWQAGICYKAPVWKTSRHLVTLGAGLQHWRFVSVKTGTNDWVLPGNLVYRTTFRRFSFTATEDSWTLLKSPLPLGSLLHTQTWLEHPIVRREHLRVVFKHGPAHTYSWNFYGTNGNRILRYQTMVVLSYKDTSIEGGYRKQWGLQPGIPDNGYWQISVAHTFSRRVR